MKILEWRYYKLHNFLIPKYVKVDSIYTNKTFFLTQEYCTLFQNKLRFPRVFKLKDIEQKVICEITEEEYNYYNI